MHFNIVKNAKAREFLGVLLVMGWFRKRFGHTTETAAQTAETTVVPGDTINRVTDMGVSASPAYAVLDVLLNKSYGLGREITEDDIDLDSFFEAYNNEIDVSTVQAGDYPTTCRGVIEGSKSPKQMIDSLLMMGKANLTYINGKITYLGNRYLGTDAETKALSTTIQLSESNILGGIQKIKFAPSNEVFNQVTVVAPVTNAKQDEKYSFTAYDANALAEDNDGKSGKVLTLELGSVQYDEDSQPENYSLEILSEIANAWLRRSRVFIEGSCKINYFEFPEVAVGKFLNISSKRFNREGANTILAKVTRITFKSNGILKVYWQQYTNLIWDVTQSDITTVDRGSITDDAYNTPITYNVTGSDGADGQTGAAGTDGIYPITVYKDSDDNPLAKPVGGTPNLEEYTLSVVPSGWSLTPTPGTSAQRQKSLTIINPTLLSGTDTKEKATLTEGEGVTGGGVVAAIAEINTTVYSGTAAVIGFAGAKEKIDVNVTGQSGSGVSAGFQSDPDPSATYVPSVFHINNIAYNGTTCVAPLGDGNVRVSTDSGASWSVLKINNSATDFVYGTATDGTIWMAALSNGDVYTTTTPSVALSWTKGSGVVGSTLVAGIAYDGTTWALASFDRKIYTTTDPTGTWDVSTAFNDALVGLITDNTTWMALGYNNSVWSSTDVTADASSWTLLGDVTISSQNEDVYTDGTTWVVVGDDKNLLTTTTPTVASSFVRVFDRDISFDFLAVSKLGSTWVVIASNGDVYTTTTPSVEASWTIGQNIGANQYTLVTNGTNLLGIGGSNVHVSSDPASSTGWTAHVNTDFYGGYYDSAISGDTHILSSNLGSIHKEIGGVISIVTSPGGSAERLRGVATDGTTWVAVGSVGKTYYSTNPTSSSGWTEGQTVGVTDLTAIATDGTTWVMVDKSGQIHYATDPTLASAWSTGQHIDGFGNVWDIIVDGSTWACVGGSDNIFVTTDPTNSSGWTNTQTTNAQTMNAVSTDGTTWVVVGDNDRYFTSTTPSVVDSWVYRTMPAGDDSYTISNNGTDWIVAGGNAGTILTTTTPTNASSWTTLNDGNSQRYLYTSYCLSDTAIVAGSPAVYYVLEKGSGATTFTITLDSSHAAEPITGTFNASSSSSSMVTQMKTAGDNASTTNVTFTATGSKLEIDSDVVGDVTDADVEFDGGTGSTASAEIVVEVIGEDSTGVVQDSISITNVDTTNGHVNSSYSSSIPFSATGDTLRDAIVSAYTTLGGYSTDISTAGTVLATSNAPGDESNIVLVYSPGTSSTAAVSNTVTTEGADVSTSSGNTATITIGGDVYSIAFIPDLDASGRSTFIYNSLSALTAVTDDYNLTIDGDTWSVESKIFGNEVDITSVLDSGKPNQTASSPTFVRIQGTSTALAWTTPVPDGIDGIQGLQGYNNATAKVYQRKATEPTDTPDTIGTFTFSTAGLIFPSAATSSNNWHNTIAGATGSEQLYVRTATVVSRDDTDTIAINEWSGVVEAGSTGSDGEDGLSNASVVYYQRTNTDVAPTVLPASTATFNLGTGVLTPVTNGLWQTFSTISSTGRYLWFTTASASSRTATDTIATGEWSDALLFTEDGAAGDTPTYEYWYTNSPGLRSEIGNPGNSTITWIDNGASNLFPNTAFWYTLRITIGSSIGAYQVAQLKAKDSGIPFVKYDITRTSPALPTLGDAQWIIDAILAVENFTGRDYETQGEFGYGTTVVIDYNINGTETTLAGTFKKGPSSDIWVAPGTFIEGSLVVSESITTDQLAANSVTSSKVNLVAGDVNAGSTANSGARLNLTSNSIKFYNGSGDLVVNIEVT